MIVGGGITGLSAAWQLQALGVEYAVLESDGRWGGKLHSEHIDLGEQGAFVLDAGAESFVTRKPELWQLAHEVGLGDRLTALKTQASGVHILYAGALHPLPLHPAAFIRSRLLSAQAKLRLLAEPFIAPRRDDEDESLADFARRRLGREASMRLIEPILGGIYNADPEMQSVLVSAPHMRALEKAHGSLMRGMLARRRHKPAEQRPAFVTVDHGVGQLVTALVSRLTGALHLNSPVSAIQPNDHGYTVTTRDGNTHSCRAVIVTTPANRTADVLASTMPTVSATLAQLQHTGIGTILLGFRSADVPDDTRMTGVMLPRREQRPLDAITWTSRRMPQRAPQGCALIKAFFGGAQPGLLRAGDGEVLALARVELRQWLHITAEPLFSRIFRWHDSYPLSTVGHLARVQAARACLPAGMYVAGSSYEGVGVPDCIRQGRTAARDAARHLGLVIT
jgi:oxygen-dependent protoporphyrinogen oxidase